MSRRCINRFPEYASFSWTPHNIQYPRYELDNGARDHCGRPTALREDTHDGSGPDDPRYVVMAHPPEKWEGQEARTGSGYDAIKRLHIRLLFEAGCRDSGFRGFTLPFGKRTRIACMGDGAPGACHSLAVRENSLFLPTNASGGQSGYGQQGGTLQDPAR